MSDVDDFESDNALVMAMLYDHTREHDDEQRDYGAMVVTSLGMVVMLLGVMPPPGTVFSIWSGLSLSMSSLVEQLTPIVNAEAMASEARIFLRVVAMSHSPIL